MKIAPFPELENRGGGRALAIPGVRRVPLAAIDVRRRHAGHAAQRVEGVDGHVEQQHMHHLLAKPAKVRGEEEVGVDAGDLANRPGGQRPGDAPNRAEVTAVLHDGVEAVRRMRPRDEIARVAKGLGHRLFAQDVTAGGKGGRDDRMAAAGGDDIEDHVRTAGGDEAGDVVRDDCAIEAELLGARRCAVRREVGEADDLEAGNARGGFEPGGAHRAAADQGSPQLHRPLPAACVSALGRKRLR